jgi:hypothetical protein
MVISLYSPCRWRDRKWRDWSNVSPGFLAQNLLSKMVTKGAGMKLAGIVALFTLGISFSVQAESNALNFHVNCDELTKIATDTVGNLPKSPEPYTLVNDSATACKMAKVHDDLHALRQQIDDAYKKARVQCFPDNKGRNEITPESIRMVGACSPLLNGNWQAERLISDSQGQKPQLVDNR